MSLRGGIMSLVVQDLSKKYGTRTVVDHLSFEMNRPGVYALLGTNGAGKTTSIRMMLGMLSRDSGTVTWNGKPLDINTCNVGYLAEERGLYPKYTIMDQLMYFAALRGVSASEAKKRIHYWAERFDIIEYLYQNNMKFETLIFNVNQSHIKQNDFSRLKEQGLFPKDFLIGIFVELKSFIQLVVTPNPKFKPNEEIIFLKYENYFEIEQERQKEYFYKYPFHN